MEYPKVSVSVMPIIASRTPEGFSARCPFCGSEINIDFAATADDAPCPVCGQLLWKSELVIAEVRRRIADFLGVSPDKITADTPFPIDTAQMDSLDTVEMVMLLEDLDIVIPDDEAERINNLGDVIRYIEERYRKRDEP